MLNMFNYARLDIGHCATHTLTRDIRILNIGK